MTIPADVRKALNLDVGAQVDVSVSGNGFIARAVERPHRERYALRDLLRGATPEAIRRLRDATAWAHQGPSVGREV